MRSEHKTTGDECDLKVRHVYCYLGRPGVGKAIKRNSHRIDRQVGKAKARAGYRDYLESN